METIISVWVALGMYFSGVDGNLFMEKPVVFTTREGCQQVVDSYKEYVKPRSYSFIATCVEMKAPEKPTQPPDKPKLWL